MNTALHPRRLVLALGLLAAGLAGVAPQLRAQATQVPSVPEETADQAWADLKDSTYDMRAQFSTGVNRLSARLDDQIRMLRAKRAGMTKDLADWDFAMKEVDDSRSDLTSRMTELSKANTPETWVAARDNIGDAWKRAEAAVDKMNTTVTS
jgi:hypothetical protein